MKLKTLSFFLAATAFVQAFTGGSGTPENPYQISTREHLEAVNNNLTAHYILTADIDLQGITYNEALIAPNGNKAVSYYCGTAFTGVFDGNGYSIKNLHINATGGLYVGFMGQSGTPNEQVSAIKNLTLDNCNITGYEHVGGFAARNFSPLTNIHVNGTVVGRNYTGGLIGWNWGKIVGCSTSGSVHTYQARDYIGGLIGYNQDAQIINSFSSSDVLGGWYVGGLIGQNHMSSLVANCYATGNVSGDNEVGGLIASNSGSSVLNSYASGNVNGNNKVGGLVGSNDSSDINNSGSSSQVNGSYYVGGLVGENYNSTITNSYASGQVQGADYLGGLVGYNYSAIFMGGGGGEEFGEGAVIVNCYASGYVGTHEHIYDYDYVCGLVGKSEINDYACEYDWEIDDYYCDYMDINAPHLIYNSFWDSDITQGSWGCDTSYSKSRNTQEMKTQSTFYGWDFVNESANGKMYLWFIVPGSYPKLYWQATPGDMDYDGVVNEGDLQIFAWQWLNTTPEGQRLFADINEDGNVDLLDFLFLAKQWLDGVE